MIRNKRSLDCELADAHNRNIEVKNLSPIAHLLRIIADFGSYKKTDHPSKEDCLGSIDNPSVLYPNHVSDTLKLNIKNCAIDHDGNFELKITPEDIPNLMRIYEPNGMGYSLRKLIDDHGVKHKKIAGQKVISFYGSQSINKYSKRKRPPQSILRHAKNLVSNGNAICNHCGCILNNESLIENQNWELDHSKFDGLTYEPYYDEKFARDFNNYQLLCKSCNASKRELDKPRENE